MHIRLILHSVLCNRLPPEAQGRAEIELLDLATLADLLAKLNIADMLYIVNGQFEQNLKRPLHDGDEVEVLLRLGGG